jgi:hypothetical protein
VADTLLMSAIIRAYNDWLAEFCRTDPARLKGIAMINLDEVPDAIQELERAARLGLAGAMITEYPLEHRRYDGGVDRTSTPAAAPRRAVRRDLRGDPIACSGVGSPRVRVANVGGEELDVARGCLRT